MEQNPDKKKGFYDITEGQLSLMWVFGIIAMVVSFAYATDSGEAFFGLLVVVIPFFLLFYTSGWRSIHRKK